jgi:hypothetical protein
MRPPPSECHAVAEAAFGEVVAKEVAGLYRPSTVCDTVLMLDDQVQRGLVRRQAAAYNASVLRPLCAYYDYNLLRCVLLVDKHGTDDCKCVETVLAWGCCPTMIYAYRVQAAPVCLSTSLACALMSDVAGRRGEQWVTALATFGCLPCSYYRVVCDKVVVGSALHTDFLRQWRCWHGRCRRIEWIAAMQL